MFQVLTDAHAEAHIKVARDIVEGLLFGHELLDTIPLVLGQLLEALLVRKVVVGLPEYAE